MNNNNNNNAYMEKRKSVMDSIFSSISRGVVEVNAIDIDKVEGVLEHLKKRRPITKEHIEFKKYEHCFNSPKEYDKFIAVASRVKDFYFNIDLMNTGKYRIFLNTIDFKESLSIFEKLVERNISGHNFISNVPRNIKYPDKWGKFINRILDYSIDEETLFKLLVYSNYSRLLNSSNKTDLLNELAYLETTRSLSINDDAAQSPYMLIKDFAKNDFIKFSKNTSIITSIGSETLCCFKKGGAGESVMMISLKSPIAGIIFGEKPGRIKWFAYVWEMVEYNPYTKCFDIQLILDNIECNNRLTREDYYEIKRSIEDTGLYSKVYLGYLRNDIDLPMEELGETRKEKPYNIPFFGKELARYSMYDDSKFIYTVTDRNITEVDYENDFERCRIDLGDFHRLQYLIKYDGVADGELKVDTDNKLYDVRFNKGFKLDQRIDLEKSYICKNNQSISEFEIYDPEGNLFASYKINR